MANLASDPVRKRVTDRFLRTTIEWRIVAASTEAARVWNVGTIPKGSIFDIACAWLPIVNGRRDKDHTGLGKDYSVIVDEPVCETRPPVPELPWKDGVAKLKELPPFSR
jgi:hypothetical protein